MSRLIEFADAIEARAIKDCEMFAGSVLPFYNKDYCRNVLAAFDLADRLRTLSQGGKK